MHCKDIILTVLSTSVLFQTCVADGQVRRDDDVVAAPADDLSARSPNPEPVFDDYLNTMITGGSSDGGNGGDDAQLVQRDDDGDDTMNKRCGDRRDLAERQIDVSGTMDQIKDFFNGSEKRDNGDDPVDVPDLAGDKREAEPEPQDDTASDDDSSLLGKVRRRFAFGNLFSGWAI